MLLISRLFPQLVSHVFNLSIMSSIFQSCLQDLNHICGQSIMFLICQSYLQSIHHVFNPQISSSVSQSCLQSVKDVLNLLIMSSVCQSYFWPGTHVFNQSCLQYTIHVFGLSAMSSLAQFVNHAFSF